MSCPPTMAPHGKNTLDSSARSSTDFNGIETTKNHFWSTNEKLTLKSVYRDLCHDEMPTPTKTKTKIPTGRSATGKKIGKRATASNGKNRDAADDFIHSIENTDNVESVLRIRTLAKVVRPMGANRLVVRLQDGDEVQIIIAGRLRFHGRAASKADRPNCMALNSIVLLDGGYAVSNLSKAHIVRIKTAYTDAGISTCRGFFDGSVGSDCEGFDWDHGETDPPHGEPDGESHGEIGGRESRSKDIGPEIDDIDDI